MSTRTLDSIDGNIQRALGHDAANELHIQAMDALEGMRFLAAVRALYGHPKHAGTEVLFDSVRKNKVLADTLRNLS